MPNYERLLRRILGGQSDANIRFRDLCSLLARLGFAESINGSHHIFRKPGIPERIVIQPIGSKAKRPQVATNTAFPDQIRRLGVAGCLSTN